MIRKNLAVRANVQILPKRAAKNAANFEKNVSHLKIGLGGVDSISGGNSIHGIVSAFVDCPLSFSMMVYRLMILRVANSLILPLL